MLRQTSPLQSVLAVLPLLAVGLVNSWAWVPSAKAQSSGPNCAEPLTQLDFNICSARARGQADAVLNQVYQQQLKQLSGADRDRLIDAELAWIQFRDTECEFQASKFEGGSLRPTIYNSCMEELTQQRTAELRNPYDIELTFAQSDRHLNRNYQYVQRNTSARRMDKLVDAQLAWIDYRDANCDYEGQSQMTYPLTRNQCLARMSNHRSSYLREINDGKF